MDIIIPSFIRVQWGNTTALKVALLVERLENGDADFTHEDRLAMLDLPDVDVVASDIDSVTTLSRSELIERGAEAPELLTKLELDLLMNRYWLDISGPEDQVMANTSDQLLFISPERKEATMERLRLLRLPLYDNCKEEQALKGAGVELKRRWDAEKSLRHEKEF